VRFPAQRSRAAAPISAPRSRQKDFLQATNFATVTVTTTVNKIEDTKV
jgi:hypothetical protein